MTNRSPYDISFPSPSEELLGICHGIKSTPVTPEIAVESIKAWMKRHLSDSELQNMEHRDPLWKMQEDCSDESMYFLTEWGLRIKNGKLLPPLPGMKYRPRLTCIQSRS